MANNEDIQSEGKLLIRYALHYGALLGLYWIIRYSFFIVGSTSYEIFKYFAYLMDVGTVLFIYAFSIKYVMSDPEHPRGFWMCLFFVTAMCFFASFLEGAAVYAHYTIIDPAYFSKMVQPLLNHLDSMENVLGTPDFEQSKRMAMTILSSKFIYIIGLFFRNTVLGVCLGALMGFFLRRKKQI